MCPISIKRESKRIKSIGLMNIGNVPWYSLKINKGIADLAVSNKSDKIPINTPPALKAFVAPTLPLPNFRTSFFVKNLTIMYEKGILPIR
jgi:hypothetical protein